MNNTLSAKCYSCILSDLKEFSLILRRSRKYNCKKGGVDCRVSRRERDIPNTFGVILVLTALFTDQELLITILQAIAGPSHSQNQICRHNIYRTDNLKSPHLATFWFCTNRLH